MKRRFYQSKLAPMIWDPEKNRLLARFEGGQFITEDDEVAEKLISHGYKEVTLDAKNPPEIPEKPIEEVGDIKVMTGGMSEKVVLAELASKETGSVGVDSEVDESKKGRQIKRRDK